MITDENNRSITITSNMYIDLTNIFVGLTPYPLTFYVQSQQDTSIPRPSIKIEQPVDTLNSYSRYAFYIYNKYLVINPDYRGIDYTVNVTAKDKFLSKPYTFTITENEFPPLYPSHNDIRIVLGRLNTNSVTLNLDDYYEYEHINYSINDVITKNSYTITGEYIIEPDIPNTPTLTNVLSVYPFFDNYPIHHDEYNNIPIHINVYSSPFTTYNSFTDNNTSNKSFIVNLSQFNTEYLHTSNIDELSIDVSHNIQRSNMFNQDTPLYELLNHSNIHIYPDYRDSSYSIILTGTGSNTYSHDNIYELFITEIAPPPPIHSGYYIFTDKVLFKNKERTFDMSMFFKQQSIDTVNNDITHLYYIATITSYSTFTYNQTTKQYIEHIEDVSNIPDNTHYIDNNKLVVTPMYRFISYLIEVHAYDPYYHTKSELPVIITVNEDRPLKLDLANLIKDIDSLGNSRLIYDLSKQIVNPFNTPLQYTLEISPSSIRPSYITCNQSVTLETTDIATELIVDGDFRDTNYTVSVNIVNPEYPQFPADISFSVTEISAPPPTPIDDFYLVQDLLSNTEFVVELDQLFSSTITEPPFKYNIVSNLPDKLNPQYQIDENKLVINPDLRGTSFNIYIVAIDSVYSTCNLDNFIRIKYTERPSVEIIDYFPLKTGNDILTIELYDYFRSPINNQLLFTEETATDTLEQLRPSYIFPDTPPVYLAGSSLTITPDYRDISYTVTVTCVDPQYPDFMQTLVLTVQEDKPPMMAPIQDKIYINKEEIIQEEKAILYNLEDFFANSPYYVPYYMFDDNEPSIPWIQLIDDTVLVIEKIPEITTSLTVKVVAKDIDNNVISSIPIAFTILHVPIISIDNLMNTEHVFNLTNNVPFDLNNEKYEITDIVRDYIDFVSINNYSNLTVKPDLRDISYNIKISQKNTLTSIQIFSLYFSITELPPYTTTLTPSTSHYTINMVQTDTSKMTDMYLDYFTPTKGNMVFSINSNSDVPREPYYITEPAYILNTDNGQITFTQNFRNSSYNIILDVYTSEKYIPVQIHHTVNEPEIYPILLSSSSIDVSNLTTCNVSINIEKNFRNYLYFYELDYSVTINSNNTIITNDIDSNTLYMYDADTNLLTFTLIIVELTMN